MIANYCDNFALQRENMPDEVWQRWRAFIKEQAAASAELYLSLRQCEGWYSANISDILREVPVTNS